MMNLNDPGIVLTTVTKKEKIPHLPELTFNTYIII